MKRSLFTPPSTCCKLLACLGAEASDTWAGLQEFSIATRLLHPPKAADDPYGASSPPIYQTATFAQVGQPCHERSCCFHHSSLM